MATINNNKESFELLRGSPDSNSASDVSELVFPPRKKRFRRRLRNNPSIKHEDITNECQCKARTVSLTLFCIVLVCWLVTLTWLAVMLNSELSRLHTDITAVAAGSQGVPDALQKCHSLSRDLQKNQTQIMDRLSAFALQLSNFSLEIAEVKEDLHAVQDQLKSSPDLVNNPRIVKDLSDSVTSFGSQIKDLGATVATLKDQNSKVDSAVSNLVTNVTELKGKLLEVSAANNEHTPAKDFAAEKEDLLKTISQVAVNLTNVNDTLSNKLQWTVDDQSKDHKLLESLQESNQNMTARVTTLEVLCAKPPEVKSFPLNETSQKTRDARQKPTLPSLLHPSSQDIPTTSQYSTNQEDESKAAQAQNPP